MDATIGRFGRVRRKPLPFWDNQRLKYNIHGELIDSTFSTSSVTQADSSDLLKTRCSTNKLKIKDNSSKFNRKSDKTLPNNYKNIVKERRKDKKSKEKRVEHYTEKKMSNSTSYSKSLRITITEEKESPLGEEEIFFTSKTTEDKGRKRISLMGDKNKDNGAVSETEICYSELRQSLDMSELIYGAFPKLMVKLFKLTSMSEVRNEHNEIFYVEDGPFDSNTGFCTGYVLMMSPTLHWGYFKSSKDILVIEGEGTIEFTQDETGDKEERPLSRRLKYNICEGGEVLIKKNEDCPRIVLFVSFIYEEYARKLQCMCK